MCINDRFSGPVDIEDVLPAMKMVVEAYDRHSEDFSQAVQRLNELGATEEGLEILIVLARRDMSSTDG